MKEMYSDGVRGMREKQKVVTAFELLVEIDWILSPDQAKKVASGFRSYSSVRAVKYSKVCSCSASISYLYISAFDGHGLPAGYCTETREAVVDKAQSGIPLLETI